MGNMQDEVEARLRSGEEREAAEREASEVKRQLEEDADREIEELQDKCVPGLRSCACSRVQEQACMSPRQAMGHKSYPHAVHACRAVIRTRMHLCLAMHDPACPCVTACQWVCIRANSTTGSHAGSGRAAACLSMPALLLLRYEGRLAAEREAGLRLKGENGIMKKKFGTLQKEIDDQRAEVAQLFEHKKELYAVRALMSMRTQRIPYTT